MLVVSLNTPFVLLLLCTSIVSLVFFSVCYYYAHWNNYYVFYTMPILYCAQLISFVLCNSSYSWQAYVTIVILAIGLRRSPAAIISCTPLSGYYRYWCVIVANTATTSAALIFFISNTATTSMALAFFIPSTATTSAALVFPLTIVLRLLLPIVGKPPSFYLWFYSLHYSAWIFTFGVISQPLRIHYCVDIHLALFLAVSLGAPFLSWTVSQLFFNLVVF